MSNLQPIRDALADARPPAELAEPKGPTPEEQAEAQFWYRYTNGRPWKIDDLKQKGYAVRCVEKPPDPSPAPVPQPRPKPRFGWR